MAACKVCSALEQVNKDDATEIISAIQDKSVSRVDIAEVLTRNGYPLTEASVRRHAKEA